MLSTANYRCNAKELILRSVLHSSIHKHSRLFRKGKEGWAARLLRVPEAPRTHTDTHLFFVHANTHLIAQICSTNKHLVFCYIKIIITRCGWFLLLSKAKCFKALLPQHINKFGWQHKELEIKLSRWIKWGNSHKSHYCFHWKKMYIFWSMVQSM